MDENAASLSKALWTDNAQSGSNSGHLPSMSCFMKPLQQLWPIHGHNNIQRNDKFDSVGKGDNSEYGTLLAKTVSNGNNAVQGVAHMSTGNTSSGMSTGNTNSDMSAGKTSSGMSTGKTSSDMSTGKASSGMSTGNTSSGMYTGNTSSGMSTGKASSDMSTGNTSNDTYTGKSISDVFTVKSSSDMSTGKTNSDVHVSTGKTNNDAKTGKSCNDVSTGKTNSDVSTEKFSSNVSTGKTNSDMSTQKTSNDTFTGKSSNDVSTGKSSNDAFTGEISRHMIKDLIQVSTGNNSSGAVSDLAPLSTITQTLSVQSMAMDTILCGQDASGGSSMSDIPASGYLTPHINNLSSDNHQTSPSLVTKSGCVLASPNYGPIGTLTRTLSKNPGSSAETDSALASQCEPCVNPFVPWVSAEISDMIKQYSILDSPCGWRSNTYSDIGQYKLTGSTCQKAPALSPGGEGGMVSVGSVRRHRGQQHSPEIWRTHPATTTMVRAPVCTSVQTVAANTHVTSSNWAPPVGISSLLTRPSTDSSGTAKPISTPNPATVPAKPASIKSDLSAIKQPCVAMDPKHREMPMDYDKNKSTAIHHVVPMYDQRGMFWQDIHRLPVFNAKFPFASITSNTVTFSKGTLGLGCAVVPSDAIKQQRSFHKIATQWQPHSMQRCPLVEKIPHMQQSMQKHPLVENEVQVPLTTDKTLNRQVNHTPHLQRYINTSTFLNATALSQRGVPQPQLKPNKVNHERVASPTLPISSHVTNIGSSVQPIMIEPGIDEELGCIEDGDDHDKSVSESVDSGYTRSRTPSPMSSPTQPTENAITNYGQLLWGRGMSDIYPDHTYTDAVHVITNDACHNAGSRYQVQGVHNLSAPVVPTDATPQAKPVPSNSKTKGRPKFSRNLNALAIYIMTQWYEEHAHHPYPSPEEKKMMATRSGITQRQVQQWFCNKRIRLRRAKPAKPQTPDCVPHWLGGLEQVKRRMSTVDEEEEEDEGVGGEGSPLHIDDDVFYNTTQHANKRTRLL